MLYEVRSKWALAALLILSYAINSANASPLSSSSSWESENDLFFSIFKNSSFPFSNATAEDYAHFSKNTTIGPRGLLKVAYLRFKVNLVGKIAAKTLATLPDIDPVPFSIRNTDLYITNPLPSAGSNQKNPLDILLLYGNPNLGTGPGGIRYETNNGFHRFWQPDWWLAFYFQDYSFVTYSTSNGITVTVDQQNYGDNVFTSRYFRPLNLWQGEAMRSGGMQINPRAGNQVDGAVNFKGIGWPYRHMYYQATMSGKLFSKGFMYL